jgi:hypothetical protein
MSNTTQTKFFEILEAELEKEKLELVVDRTFSNTGIARVQAPGKLKSLFIFRFSFQDDYTTFEFTPALGDKTELTARHATLQDIITGICDSSREEAAVFSNTSKPLDVVGALGISTSIVDSIVQELGYCIVNRDIATRKQVAERIVNIDEMIVNIDETALWEKIGPIIDEIQCELGFTRD